MNKVTYINDIFPELKLYFEIRNMIYHGKYIILIVLENLFAFWLAENDWGENREGEIRNQHIIYIYKKPATEML